MVGIRRRPIDAAHFRRSGVGRVFGGMFLLVATSCSAAGGGLGGSDGLGSDSEEAFDAHGGVGGAAQVSPQPSAGSRGDAPEFPAAGPASAQGHYDPSVTFEFPETAPGDRPCKAGRYTGMFDGFYAPGVAVWPSPIPVFGDIQIVLEETQDGEFLAIGDGTLEGVALGLFPFQARISGRVNCSAGLLEDGFLNDGVYIVGVLPYTFSGPFTADFDPLTNSFVDGRWIVGEPDWATRTYGGEGTWQASWVP
jgi:hypothetical protein